MAKVYAPNKQYTGVSASVLFCNGVGETDRESLLQWFTDHGYQVDRVKKSKKEKSKAEKESTGDEHDDTGNPESET